MQEDLSQRTGRDTSLSSGSVEREVVSPADRQVEEEIDLSTSALRSPQNPERIKNSGNPDSNLSDRQETLERARQKFAGRRVLIVTDSWYPLMSGVVRTLENTTKQLESFGCEVECLHPQMFKNYALPFQPDFKLAIPNDSVLRDTLKRFDAHHIHIATEGPLGLQARQYCLDNGYKFSTAFHTLINDHLKKMIGVPRRLTTAYLKWFHQESSRVMVPTPSIMGMLYSKGFRNLSV